MSDSVQPPIDEFATANAGRRLGRWQFSLRELLLFVLLVAMGVALFTTGLRLRRAEKELADYRREYGILKVEDPAMLYAVARWTPEPGQWRWNAHFPPGRYDICYATTGICEEGIPKPSGGYSLDLSGDVTLSAAFLKDPTNGKWACHFNAGQLSGPRDMPDSVVNPRFSSTTGVQWNQEPAVVAPSTPLVLLRRRIGTTHKDGSCSMSALEPTDGLIIWIRRMGEPTGGACGAW